MAFAVSEVMQTVTDIWPVFEVSFNPRLTWRTLLRVRSCVSKFGYLYEEAVIQDWYDAYGFYYLNPPFRAMQQTFI
jgi:hypothetical protein